MTYCLALNLNAGLVLLADSRTNAGVDNISTFSKLFTWERAAPNVPNGPPARCVAMLCAGNLSITQEIVSLIDEEIAANGPNQENGYETILTATNMFRVADRIGQKMIEVQSRRGPALGMAGVDYGATLIVAGRIGPNPGRIFLVYQAGNFIETTPDTPFLQIGEAKYGKPILDRVLSPHTTIADGVRAALLSMDATIRSNLSVGMPLDLAVAQAGNNAWIQRRIEGDDPIYRQMSEGWAEHLRSGFMTMPEMPLQL